MSKTIYIILLSLLTLSSCEKSGLKEELIRLKESTIIMPYSKMERIYLSSTDTVSESQLMIVHYIDDFNCTDCIVKDLANKEISKKIKYKIQHTYIIDCNKQTAKTFCNLMEKHLSQGIIYIDSTRQFIKTNPQVAKSKLFHTLVINNTGKVLLVGDPYLNNKMTSLFEQIIEKEFQSFQ